MASPVHDPLLFGPADAQARFADSGRRARARDKVNPRRRKFAHAADLPRPPCARPFTSTSLPPSASRQEVDLSEPLAGDPAVPPRESVSHSEAVPEAPTSSHAMLSGNGSRRLGSRGGVDLRDSPELSDIAAGAPDREPVARIRVSDPVKRSQESVIPGFMSAHTEYLVTTQWAGINVTTHVHRRFRDFVALADLLDVRYRGYFVYPRPDKNALEGQLGGGDLVRTRITELERYLSHLVTHPVVGPSEELRVFLRAEGPLSLSTDWANLQPLRGSLLEGVSRLPRQLLGSDSSVPSASEAAQNAKNTSDLLRRFRELGERVKQDLGNTQPELTEEEVVLREKRSDVEAYIAKIAQTSRKAEKLVQEVDEHGSALGDFGMSLIRLANYEDQETSKLPEFPGLASEVKPMAAETRRIGSGAVRYRRLIRQGMEHLTKTLSPLHDELALGPAIVRALREREAALLTAHLITIDIKKKTEALASLRNEAQRTPAANKKVAALEAEISAAEAAHTAAQAEYDRVKTRNLEELARWGETKQHDFAGVAHGLGLVMQGLDSRTAEIMRASLDEGGHMQAPGIQRA